MATYEAILQNVDCNNMPMGRGVSCTPCQIPPNETLGFCRVAFTDTKLLYIQGGWDVVEWATYLYGTNQNFICWNDPETGEPVLLGRFA